MQFHTFALTEDAFARACDERFTFHSSAFHGACARLLRHLDAGDPGVMLIGSPGSGKTTLLRYLAGRLADRGWSVLWHDPRCGPPPETGRGAPRLILVDNADDLPEDILGDICWAATNTGTFRAQGPILLAGTEALLEPMANAARGRDLPLVRLAPLPRDEVAAYVQHRLKVAGAADLNLFTPPALTLLAECSRGVPGTVNRLAVTALVLAELEGRERIDDSVLREAANDLGIADLIGLKADQRAHRQDAPGISSTEGQAALPPGDSKAAAALPELPVGSRRWRLGAAVAASMATLVVVGLVWTLGKPHHFGGVRDHPGTVATVAAGGASATAPVADQQLASAAAEHHPFPASPQDISPAGTSASVAIVSSSGSGEAAQPVPATLGVPGVAATELAASIRRGDELLGLGDIAAARLYYDFAMQRGSAEATRKLARTYDPAFLENAGVSGMRSDQGKAIAMYRTAADMGDDESAVRIAALGGAVADGTAK